MQERWWDHLWLGFGRHPGLGGPTFTEERTGEEASGWQPASPGRTLRSGVVGRPSVCRWPDGARQLHRKGFIKNVIYRLGVSCSGVGWWPKRSPAIRGPEGLAWRYRVDAAQGTQKALGTPCTDSQASWNRVMAAGEAPRCRLAERWKRIRSYTLTVGKTGFRCELAQRPVPTCHSDGNHGQSLGPIAAPNVLYAFRSQPVASCAIVTARGPSLGLKKTAQPSVQGSSAITGCRERLLKPGIAP